MIAENMKEMVKGSSVIRAMFEEGARMAAAFGRENVYDFSLGNPSVPPPAAVAAAISEALANDPAAVHGYMNNAGFPDVRRKIAEATNNEFGLSLGEDNVFMTVGAAGALNIALKTLLNPGDEVLTFAPCFGEYAHYAGNYGGRLVVAASRKEDFQPDIADFESKITAKTKAVIINSPNNPSGAIYTEDTLRALASALETAQKRFARSIYLISDEPYRKIVYSGAAVPYVTRCYKNTLVAYSFSKSLSLPGERIGYLIAPDELDARDDVLAALSVANRILGFVNAPSLFQRVAAACVAVAVDVSPYEKNRDVLYNSLTGMGYECVKPEGAFYLFPKSPIPDDTAFCQAAKQFNLLVVPGSAFRCPGYFRAAFCVSHETCLNSLDSFRKALHSVT